MSNVQTCYTVRYDELVSASQILPRLATKQVGTYYIMYACCWYIYLYIPTYGPMVARVQIIFKGPFEEIVGKSVHTYLTRR